MTANLKKRPKLIRDPADWARQFGWINKKQADALRARIAELEAALAAKEAK